MAYQEDSVIENDPMKKECLRLNALRNALVTETVTETKLLIKQRIKEAEKKIKHMKEALCK